MEYNIVYISNSKDFCLSLLGIQLPEEKDYELIEFYSKPQILTGCHKQELLLLGDMYGSFQLRSNLGYKFLIERNNKLYWYKFVVKGENENGI